MSLLHNICIRSIQGRTDELVVMETRKPKWNDKLDAWTMDFKGDYPFKPPKINFITKIFHPGVNQQTGEINMGPVLRAPWHPLRGIKYCITYILNQMRAVNNESAMASYMNLQGK